MIRLLVADDSALIRRLFSEIFAAEGDFEVGFARNGPETLRQLAEFQPDVITLDVAMPELDGLACLDRIMLERPTPVVMVSSLTATGAEATFRALELGAVEALAKPSGAMSLRMDAFAPQLVGAVRAAAAAQLPAARRLAERVRSRIGAHAQPPERRPRRATSGVVVIGCSTGGPAALDAVLSELPADFPWPVLVAQHMPASFTAALASRLDKLTPLHVQEVARALPVAPGGVYVGRGDADMVVARRAGRLLALPAPPLDSSRWRPSVDRLTESVMAHVAPGDIVGVLMTGMGDDGAAAMTRLSMEGGRTLAEAQSSAVIWGMPGELVRRGGAQCVEPVERIGRRLAQWAGAT